MRLCRRAHTSWHSLEECELKQWFLAPCMKKYTRANPLTQNTPLSLTVCFSVTLCPKYLSCLIEDPAADESKMQKRK
ncbi:hypothetical protein NDU88_009563 [Pleurodeles waltl]|uniref:Uncharacterized protein n=1 Tax=Pleurodeles waltl TaxID=8319 RepID=A0AAV7NZG6_PLEWA|nr:hypothetical protein NDU88_009563 [Pleurodeles waltl]